MRVARRGSVASGVTSRGERPVPPVVNTRRAPDAAADVIAARMASTSSGMTVTEASTPCSARRRAARGPERSSAVPAWHRSETVMTRAGIMSVSGTAVAA